jgi:hypothetical protein
MQAKRFDHKVIIDYIKAKATTILANFSLNIRTAAATSEFKGINKYVIFRRFITNENVGYSESFLFMLAVVI